MASKKIEPTVDRPTGSFQEEYFAFPEKSLMDSCDEGEDVDIDDDEEEESNNNLNIYGSNNDDRLNHDEVEETEEGPCKMRTAGIMQLLRTNSLYNGMNSMGQTMEGVVKSVTSNTSRCSGSSSNEHSNNAASFWQTRDHIHNNPSTESIDTATTSGGRYYSWDEQSNTFSKFMRSARADVTKHIPMDLDFIRSTDTDTTTTSSAQEGEIGFVPSLDNEDDEYNDDDDDDDDDDYSFSVTSSEANAKNRHLIKTLPDQPALLGAAKEIGEGLLLRTRSNLIEAGAASLPKTGNNPSAIARSRSFESSDLAKVAARLNRQKLQSSNKTNKLDGHGKLPQQSSALYEIAEEDESHFYDSDDDTADAKPRSRSASEKQVRFVPTMVMLPVSNVSNKNKLNQKKGEIEPTTGRSRFSVMTALQSRVTRSAGAIRLNQTARECTRGSNCQNQKGAASLLAILKSSGKIIRTNTGSDQNQSESNKITDCEIKDDEDNAECIVFGCDDGECEVLLSRPEESSFLDPPLDQTLITAEKDCVEITSMKNQVDSQEEEDVVEEEFSTRKKTIQMSAATEEKSPSKTGTRQLPKRQTVIAGVTFEVALPAITGDSDEDRLQQQLGNSTLNRTLAQMKAENGPGDNEELVNVSTKVFIDMFDGTKLDIRPPNEMPPTKNKSWRSKLQQRTSNFFGRKKDHKEKSTGKITTAIHVPQKSMTVEDRRCPKDLHLDYTTTEESTDSYATYDISNSKSSLSFAFSESMKKVSMLQVVNAINEELRVMNERSLSAGASKNTYS